MSTKHTPTERVIREISERFDRRAAESYAKHCKDPVAAAESDLLGRALGKLERIKHLVCGDKNPNWTDQTATTNTRGVIADICDALLAETKETPK